MDSIDGNDRIDDTAYWKEFYALPPLLLPQTCSAFCEFVMEYFANDDGIRNVLDAGCGNGRDSFALAERYLVDAVDNSGFLPDSSSEDRMLRCRFFTGDFVSCDKGAYDLVYSRFTLHAIPDQDQRRFLESILPDTYLAFEARSTLDRDRDHVHGNGHYRNHVDLAGIRALLVEVGYEIVYMREGDNVAVYKTENPVCIRAICRRKR